MLALHTTVITDFVSYVIEFTIAAASAYLIIMTNNFPIYLQDPIKILSVTVMNIIYSFILFFRKKLWRLLILLKGS